MIYLLWAILNIAFAIYFFYLCYKGIKLVRREMGLGAAIILFIGLISLSSSCNEFKKLSSKESKKWHFISDTVSTSHQSQTIVVNKNMMFNINLSIIYGTNKESNQTIPISATSGLSGVTSGIDWEPENITINIKSPGSELEYEVSGKIKWHLLGGTIRTEYKNYEGTTNLPSYKTDK